MAHQKLCKHHWKVNGTIYQVNIGKDNKVDINKYNKNVFKSKYTLHIKNVVNIVSIMVGLLGLFQLGGQVDIGGHQQNQHSGHQEVPRECV